MDVQFSADYGAEQADDRPVDGIVTYNLPLVVQEILSALLLTASLPRGGVLQMVDY